MKIAAATDDGTRLSAHFGRASAYLVVTAEGDHIVDENLREKPAHHGRHKHGEPHDHGPGRGHGAATGGGDGRAARHTAMVEPIRDCQVVLARGMGRGAHDALREAGIEPLLVREDLVADAVRAYLDGTLVTHPERLH